MDATFYFRKKIGCAALPRSRALVEALQAAVAQHPWFFMAPQHEAHIVWSDAPVAPAFAQQRILYLGAVEGGDQALYIPSAQARALTALIEPLQRLAGVRALQVTALFPPSYSDAHMRPEVPSMALFYQTIPMREEEGERPLKWELTRLLGANLATAASITCLYAPITQGPYLVVTAETEREVAASELIAKWCALSPFPATPSMLSPDFSQEAFAKEAFIVYQDTSDAPVLRMQSQFCLIGQLRLDGKQLRVCVVPPNRVLSLLACTESLVTSGDIYW